MVRIDRDCMMMMMMRKLLLQKYNMMKRKEHRATKISAGKRRIIYKENSYHGIPLKRLISHEK